MRGRLSVGLTATMIHAPIELTRAGSGRVPIYSYQYVPPWEPK
jgi:hypothetical protein